MFTFLMMCSGCQNAEMKNVHAAGGRFGEVGLNIFRHSTEVYFVRPAPVDDAILPSVVPSLQALKPTFICFDGVSIGDVSAAQICRVESLETVYLLRTRFTEHGVLELAPMKNLRSIALSGPNWTPAVLQETRAKMPNVTITLFP